MTTAEALKYLNKETKLPKRMQDKLKRWREVYYGISLHTLGAAPHFKDLTAGGVVYPPNYYGAEYQRLFEKFLMNRHPREDDNLRWWRFSQYRAMTKAPFGQVTEILSGAIFQDSNYTIDIPDKNDNAYIWGNHFSGYDLLGYFANIGLKNITEDPNGLFVRMPVKPYYETLEEKVEIGVYFANTKDIVYYDDNDLIYIDCESDYAYHIDRTTIFRFTLGDNKKWILAPQDSNGYYAHMMGKLPVTVAGGEWNTQGYFESYYDKAKAIADDFIATYSGAQMVDKEASHPFIITEKEDCPECQGVGSVTGNCSKCSGDGCAECSSQGKVLERCNSCGGSGKNQSRNPGQWMVVDKENVEKGGVSFRNPEISINSHHRETVKQLLEWLLKSLHLYDTDKSESGAAKAIDQERNYKFVSKVSNHVFDRVIYDTIRDIIAYRNVTTQTGTLTPAEYPFYIIKPTQFQIRTSKELLDEFEQGTKANMPIIVRKRLADDYVDKAYSGDLVMKKKMAVVNSLDTLSLYSSDEILNLRAANAITQEDMLFSRMLPIYLDRLLEEKGEEWFIKVSLKDIKPLVEALKPKPVEVQ